MKLAFHGGTSMPHDLVTDVLATKQAGFKLLEVWAGKVDKYLESHSLAELKALFVDNGVTPEAMSSIEFIAFQGPNYPTIRNRLRELAIIAEYIGCRTLVVVPSPAPHKDVEAVIDLFVPWEEVVNEYVTVLRDLADIAKPHGLRLAFEFLGFGWCTVRTPRLCYEIIQKAGRDNVGMNFDCCHFYNGGGLLSEMNGVDPAQVYSFHLNDMEDVPKEAITDSRRLLPGHGVLPLDEYCACLKSIGYDGVCSIELFRDEYYAWDAYELTAKCYEAAVKILSPYFNIE